MGNWKERAMAVVFGWGSYTYGGAAEASSRLGPTGYRGAAGGHDLDHDDMEMRQMAEAVDAVIRRQPVESRLMSVRLLRHVGYLGDPLSTFRPFDATSEDDRARGQAWARAAGMWGRPDAVMRDVAAGQLRRLLSDVSVEWSRRQAAAKATVAVEFAS